MFYKNEPFLETKMKLKGNFQTFCRASETEKIEILDFGYPTLEVKKTTYAVATTYDGIYLIDVKEIDKSQSEYITAIQSQKDLPIHAIATLVGRIKLYGNDS